MTTIIQGTKKNKRHIYYDYGVVPSNIQLKQPDILNNHNTIETEHAIPKSLLETRIMDNDSKLAAYVSLFMCGAVGSYIACGGYSNKKYGDKDRNIFTANIFEKMILNFNNSEGFHFIKTLYPHLKFLENFHFAFNTTKEGKTKEKYHLSN